MPWPDRDVAGLGHELVDDAVERDAGVVATLGEGDDALDMQRRDLGQQFDIDDAVLQRQQQMVGFPGRWPWKRWRPRRRIRQRQ